MYQQSPTIEGGNKIQSDWWQYYTKPPNQFERIIVGWDTAWSAKTSSDYSVAAVWGITKSGYYLIELQRDRVEFPKLVEWAHNISERFPGCIHLIEDAASGRPLYDTLRLETRYPVHAQKVQTDKVARLNDIISNIQEGRCYLPQKSDWLHDFLDEHRKFPTVRNDDQVDTTSLVLKYAGRRFPMTKSSKINQIGIGFKESMKVFTKNDYF